MKTLGLMLVLLAGAALAQPVVTRGGALKKRAYQTYGNLTLYVDPTGSDSGACTGTGTAACATIQGAVNKLPPRINHTVTINIAAGTYSALNVRGFTVDITSGSLNFVGAMQRATVATGSTSGTLTASSIATTTDPSSQTDSGQTWTVNNLRGKFITVAGVSYPIAKNTATTVYGLSNTALSGAYTIDEPAVVISGNSSIQGILLGGTSGLTFKNVKFTGTSGVTLSVAQNVNTTVFTECSFEQGPSASSALSVSARFSLVRVSAFGLASASANLVTVIRGSTKPELVSSLNSVFWHQGTGQPFAVQAGAASSTGFSLNYFAGATATSGGVLRFSPTGAESFLSSPVWRNYIECLSGSSVGLMIGPGVASTNPSAYGPAYVTIFTTISGCGTAVEVSNGSTLTMGSGSGIVINNSTTGISIIGGGKVDLRFSAPTFNTVTNEYALDGTIYTSSFVEALSPKVLSSSRGSLLLRE